MPDVRTARKIARNRFFDSFRRRRSGTTASSAKLARVRKPGRKRKRSAIALGVSTLSLAGVSQFAVSADRIAAEQTAEKMERIAEEKRTDPSERRLANDLSVSDRMVEAMIEEEGVRYTVYRDVAGYPTVGVGHLILPEDGLSIGDTVSYGEAMRFLENDLETAEDAVKRLVGDLPINQHEFDALVDLVFNVGEGNVSENKSPRLNAAIAAGDYDAIAAELEYTTAGNAIARGLVYRSERRSQVFMNADYSDPREA